MAPATHAGTNLFSLCLVPLHPKQVSRAGLARVSGPTGSAVGTRRALHLSCGSHSGHFAAPPLLLVERQCLLEPDSGAMLPAACITRWLCDLGQAVNQLAPRLPHQYNSDNNSTYLSFCGTGKQMVIGDIVFAHETLKR